MENITIRYLDHPKLEDPTFIEGLPGIGNVGKLAAEHLKDELKAVKFAEIFSKYFPPQVLVQDDGQVKLVNNEMHFVKRGPGRDLVLLTGDYQGLTPEGQYELSDFILRELKKLGVRRIFTLGGYGMGRMVTKPRVLGAATGADLVKEMEKYGVVFSRGEPGAGIVGASGLLLGLGRLYDMQAVCLMGETSGYFVDPKSAQAFLKGFEEGLKSAWREIGSLTTRGYSSTELGVLAKSKLAVLFRDVEAMESRLIEEEGIPVVGGGELSARSDIGRRGVYLVREPKAERVFSLFSDLLQTNARGLCITRIHPDDLRSRYPIEGAGFIWLSKSAGGTAKGMAIAEPSALVDIATAISDFASDGGNAAVVLEGLEYMISQNGFASIMRFLQKVNEKITLNDSYLLISANPAAMKEQEYRLLAKEVAAEI